MIDQCILTLHPLVLVRESQLGQIRSLVTETQAHGLELTGVYYLTLLFNVSFAPNHEVISLRVLQVICTAVFEDCWQASLNLFAILTNKTTFLIWLLSLVAQKGHEIRLGLLVP